MVVEAPEFMVHIGDLHGLVAMLLVLSMSIRSPALMWLLSITTLPVPGRMDDRLKDPAWAATIAAR